MYNGYMNNKINASEIQRKGLKKVYENIDKYSTFHIENTRQDQDLYITKYKNNLGYVIQHIRSKKSELEDSGFENIVIFGSLATGKATSNSDIDISFNLKNESKTGAIEIISKTNKLKEILSDLNNLDLHHYSFLKENIKSKIINEGVSVL